MSRIPLQLRNEHWHRYSCQTCVSRNIWPLLCGVERFIGRQTSLVSVTPGADSEIFTQSLHVLLLEVYKIKPVG